MSWGWYEETEVWSTGRGGYIGDMNMTWVNGTQCLVVLDILSAHIGQCLTLICTMISHMENNWQEVIQDQARQRLEYK